MNEPNFRGGRGVGDVKLEELGFPGHKARCRGQRSGSGQDQEEPEVPDQVHLARTSSRVTKVTEAELQHREREELAVPQWQFSCPSTAANQRQETVKFKPPPTSSAGTCPESVCRKCGRWPRPRRGGGEKGGLSHEFAYHALQPAERRAAAPIRAPFPNQKSEAAETPKTPASSCDSTNAAVAKQALKKPLKGKQAPRKKAQGKTQQNRKLTDFYPVRRSSRKSKAELQSAERKRIDELIESGKEEGMKIDLIDGKGRGVIATKQFSRGDFVVEYHGDLIEITDAKKREALYAQDPSTGCYMYYFQYLSKTYCVDATRETNRLGRLINHSQRGNCQTKLHDIDGVPHLILIASRDIAAGEELLYDYGDRSRASIEAYPWLKH
ncbi:N-lysine methyltransferase SETD8 [Sciurus carolinensis]|uniref:N-lysine methyltransferase KMT5A n=1 Tax=Sciurus carolinensis TaxID=30640 RepID=A0AA41SZX6_SCICA|nr:N-lysine methyltransferase SETD8 [Sciurus carolinensis]